MKVYQSKKDFYCRAYNKKTKTTKIIHGSTKKEAIYNAQVYMRKTDTSRPITFKTAFEEMVDERTTLSPSTVKAYKVVMRNHLKDLADIKLTNIDTKTVQKVIDQLTARLAPKSVANAYGVVTSVMTFHDVPTRLKVKLPIIPPKKKKLPSTSEIRALIDTCEDNELKTVIELAIYGGLRRGEACALEGKDLSVQNGKYILSITRTLVLNDNKEWEYKSPKSRKGYREIEIPERIAKKIKKGKLIECTPSAISARFRKHAKAMGFKYSFHTLRHWSATYMKHKGCSDEEVMLRFGWNSLNMLSVYVDVIDDMSVSSTAVSSMANDLA